MKLKDWRKKRKLSQAALAQALEDYAREKSKSPSNAFSSKKLGQTTLGCWERGTLPRKFWLGILRDFTKNQVDADDFILNEEINGA